MAAKVPVKKKVTKKPKAKASKTKIKFKYTPAQYKAYNAASKKAIAAARAQARAAAARARFIANAKAVQRRRNTAAARSKAHFNRSGRRQPGASGKQAIIRLKILSSYAAAYKRRTQTYTYQQAAFLTGLATTAANRRAIARVLARKKLKPKKAVAKKTHVPKTPAVKTAHTPKYVSPYAAAGAKAGAAAAAKVKPPKPVPKKPLSKTRKAAAVTPAVNPEWIVAGNDKGVENCVGVAIANHLLLHTYCRLNEQEIRMLFYRDSVAKALNLIDYQDLWKGIGLSEYGQIEPEDAKPGDIVGFETPQGSHCAVLMPDHMVISWGEIVPLESDIDEAWEVTWTTSR